MFKQFNHWKGIKFGADYDTGADNYPMDRGTIISLPVTLDFAKVLSRMSKQNEAIYNKAYDFRYFM